MLKTHIAVPTATDTHIQMASYRTGAHALIAAIWEIAALPDGEAYTATVSGEWEDGTLETIVTEPLTPDHALEILAEHSHYEGTLASTADRCSEQSKTLQTAWKEWEIQFKEQEVREVIEQATS